MSSAGPEFRLRRMTLGDLPRVMELENQAFSNPWSPEMVKNELSHDWSTILLGELRIDGRWLICAMAIFWLVADEIHILNVATDGVYRRQGLARRVLTAALTHAREHRCTRAILEVRRSNEPAINLYASLGFLKIGLRPNYYQDNREDAVVMAADLPQV